MIILCPNLNLTLNENLLKLIEVQKAKLININKKGLKNTYGLVNEESINEIDKENVL